MKEFAGYDRWKTDPGWVHPDDRDRVTAERVMAASVAPVTVEDINAMLEAAAQEQKGQAVPQVPRSQGPNARIYAANRAFDEAARARGGNR